jgi:uncharacterized protein YigA (DUF484 family)
MSTQPEPNYIDELPSEEAVYDFLESHPEFFERHPTLLGRMELAHASGAAVSLVERQVSVLRQKDAKLGRQLKELVSVARENDALAEKIHELSMQLLSSSSLSATIAVIEEAMRTGFNADHSVLVMFADDPDAPDVDAGRFFRAVRRDDPAIQPFATFLESSTPRCGQARDAQLDYLFRSDSAEVGSVALVPLGEQCSVGLLAIGSSDAARFNPGMSIEFLTRVGQLVAAAISRY